MIRLNVKDLNGIIDYSYDFGSIDELNVEVSKQQDRELHWGKYASSDEYSMETIDLTQDFDYLEHEAIMKRKVEYPSVEEIIEVILDHGMNSQEFVELQNLRQSVKNKYKKPVR